MRRITLYAIVLSLLAALAWWLAPPGAATGSSLEPVDAAAEALAPRLVFRAAETWQLDVRYSATTTTLPLGDGGAVVGGAATMTGAVEMHVVEVRGDTARLALSVTRCDEGSVRVLDRDLLAALPDCARALAGTLVVEVDVRGAVRGMAAGAGTPTLGTRVLEALALDLFVPLPEGAGRRETLRDTTPRGAHDVNAYATPLGGGFDIDFAADGPLADARLPGADAQVRAEATVDLRAGRLSRVHLQEHLAGTGVQAVTELDAILTTVSTRAPSSALRTLALGPAFQSSAEAQQAALAAQRSAGLTAPEVMDAVALVNAGAVPGDHSRFLWRATALVKQDAALARHLADAASEPALGTRGRALCLDLLAQAGSVDAERALLSALGSEAARADPHHAVHVQRVSLLEHPSATTADAVLAALANEARADIRGAWLTSAGAVSASIEDAAQARALKRAITDALDRGGAELEPALLGIANSGDPALASRAEPLVGHEDAAVRALALRAITDARLPRLADRLSEAAQDRASLVQRVALRALDQHFAQEAVAAVARAVDADLLRRDNARVALDVLKHHGHEDPARTRAVLELMSQDDRLAAEERAAARSLSGALERGAWATGG